MTYPQQPNGGQDPAAGHDGFGAPPPPPQKKNTAVIVSLAGVLLLVLAGVGITGFIAPGYFLSSAEDALAVVIDRLDSQDTEALEDIACADAEPAVAQAIDDTENVTGAKLVDTEEIADDKVTGTVEVTVNDHASEYTVTVTLVDDEWCWQDIEPVHGLKVSDPTEPSGPGGGGKAPTLGELPVPDAALAVMQTFLDAINAGNAAAAKGTLCGDAHSNAADVDELVGWNPDLEIDPSDGLVTSSGFVGSAQLTLHGTAKGQELKDNSDLLVGNSDGPWCVFVFHVVVT